MGIMPDRISRRTLFNLLTLFFITVVLGSCGSASLPSLQPQKENVARGKSYTLQPKPNYSLTTDSGDTTQLTDGQYTQGYFWTQNSTVGWQNFTPVIITLDLGKNESISGVSFNTAAGAGGVTWPDSIRILVSDDGEKYSPADDLLLKSNAENGAPSTNGYRVQRYHTNSLKTHGRFVQFVVDTVGPFCFVDEIEVYRGEPAWVTLPLSGPSTAGGMEYFRVSAADNGIRKRLLLDLQETRAALKSSGLAEQDSAAFSKQLAEIETSIDQLPHVETETFKAELPFNPVHARIFGIRGKMKQLQGTPVLQAWTNHPYDYITPVQGPDKDSGTRINVFMMRGEWRSAVVNLTNSSDKAISAHLNVEGLPGGANPKFIDVYKMAWTDTREHEPIAAALVPAPRGEAEYVVDIPAGLVRQVWLSLHPVEVPTGIYYGQVSINTPMEKPIHVPIQLQIFPAVFPDKPTLHLGGWDYTDRNMHGVTEENRSSLIAQLQEHFVDSPWGTSAVLAMGAFDADGQMAVPSTRIFDNWVARWEQASRYCVFVNAAEELKGAKAGTPQFNKRINSWINFWVEHAKQKGIKAEQLTLLLVDEPTSMEEDRLFSAWAKAIRTAQPRVVLWENPAEGLPEIFSSADVLAPEFSHIMAAGKEVRDFYRQQRVAGRRLELYSASGPMELIDPSYIRMQAWTAWAMGAEGIHFWSFSDTKGGSLWQPYTSWGKNYAPLFLTMDSVTSAKQLEVIRESVQDFEYFVLLKSALNKSRPDHPAASRAKDLLENGAQRVIDSSGGGRIRWNESRNRWKADEVRYEILQTLAELQ